MNTFGILHDSLPIISRSSSPLPDRQGHWKPSNGIFNPAYFLSVHCTKFPRKNIFLRFVPFVYLRIPCWRPVRIASDNYSRVRCHYFSINALIRLKTLLLDFWLSIQCNMAWYVLSSNFVQYGCRSAITMLISEIYCNQYFTSCWHCELCILRYRSIAQQSYGRSLRTDICM